MKKWFVFVLLLIPSLGLSALSTNYQLVNCTQGEMEDELTISLGEQGLQVSNNSGVLFELEKINQGPQESWEFVSLGLQYRHIKEASFDGTNYKLKHAIFGHLIGSPLGMPKLTTLWEMQKKSLEEVQIAYTQKNALGMVLEKKSCLYQVSWK